MVSVGPYRFHRRTEVPAPIASARSLGSGSPAVIRSLTPDGIPPALTSIRQPAGVACSAVAPLPASRSCSRAASSACSASATTTHPPASTGASSSTRAMSNAKVVVATNRSSGPSASIGRRAFSSVAMPPWVTLTAFGRPVDPEVKIVTAVADGGRSSTGSARPPSAGGQRGHVHDRHGRGGGGVEGDGGLARLRRRCRPRSRRRQRRRASWQAAGPDRSGPAARRTRRPTRCRGSPAGAGRRGAAGSRPGRTRRRRARERRR